MCNLSRKYDMFVIALCLCLLFHIGCAGKAHHSFENKVKKMSDTELVSYFNGIEDKIRTVDNKMQADERSNGNSKRPDPNVNLIPSPFWMGGVGYDLVEQRKVVLKEMGKRNITP